MSRLRQLLGSRFAKAQEGLAAVEFAFLLPVMLTLFFGVVETSLALICQTDVVSIASTMSDLVAQKNTITNSDISNVLSAANTILYPYPTAPARIIITSIIDNGGTTSGRVAWSDAQNATAHSIGSSMTVPAGLIPTGGSVILTEVTYTYTSPTTKIITGPITMTNSFYSRPRRVAQITRVNS